MAAIAQRPSLEQLQGLIEFLEQRRDLARNRLRGPDGRRQAIILWRQISERLNAMGGAHKSDKQWQKFWADKKSALKKRAAAARREAFRTGGGQNLDPGFSELENRAIALMGEGFGHAEPGIAVPAFPRRRERSQEHAGPAPLPAAPVQVDHPQASPEEIVIEEFMGDQPALEQLVAEEPFLPEGGPPDQPAVVEADEPEAAEEEPAAPGRGRRRELHLRRASAFADVRQEIVNMENRRAAGEEAQTAHLGGIEASLQHISGKLDALTESSIRMSANLEVLAKCSQQLVQFLTGNRDDV